MWFSPFLARISSISLKICQQSSPLCCFSPPCSHIPIFTSILILPALFCKCLFMYLLFPITYKLLKSRYYVFIFFLSTYSQAQCWSSSEFMLIKTPGIEVQCFSVVLNWTELNWSQFSHLQSLKPFPLYLTASHSSCKSSITFWPK